jgi:hypothetical protein
MKMFLDAAMIPFPGTPGRREYNAGGSRYFSFFGATPESWIGKIWPRGRDHQNELSTATLADNFCNGWSGGVNSLSTGTRALKFRSSPMETYFRAV